MPGRATNEPSNYVAFGFQTAKGTEATTYYFLKHLDGSGFDVEDEVQSEREGGAGQGTGFRYRSQIKGDGALVANGRVDVAGRMLGAIQGTDASAIVGAGPTYKHTATFAATVPYFTVDQYWADVIERAVDCKATQLEIEWAAGRPPKFSLTFISGGAVFRRTTAALTPVREAPKPTMYPGSTLVLTGAPGAKMTKGKLTIKREIDDDIYTNQLYREDAVETAYDVDLEGTLKYEDNVLYNTAKYGSSTGTVVPVDLSTIGLDLLLPRDTHSIKLLAPTLDIADTKVNKLDPDGKTMYVDFSAMSGPAVGAFTSEVISAAVPSYLSTT